MANRVKRVATGWEPQLTIAVDSVIARATVMELCEAFFATRAAHPPAAARRNPVRHAGGADLRARPTWRWAWPWHGQPRRACSAGPWASVSFIFAVAPHHPLATGPALLTDEMLRQHRASPWPIPCSAARP
jgi:hypothetical protein